MRQTLPRDESSRKSLRRVFANLGYEVIPFKSAEEGVLAHVPRSVRLTVTASPAKGVDATVELTERLTKHGYTVAPHLSARQLADRTQLADLVARLADAGVHQVFVVGGDATDTPSEFRDAHALLLALQELEHPFTHVGIAGHPEGHPSVPDELLFDALKQKSQYAHHITTQICFRADAIVAWARELRRRAIDLPIHIGTPGSVHRQKLLRVASGLGVGESARFLKKQQNLIWRFFTPGGYSPNGLIRDLAPHLGGPDSLLGDFHIFTFNDLEPTEAWRRAMLERLGD